MFLNFVQPLENILIENFININPDIQNYISFFKNEPTITPNSIVIFGVEEYRGFSGNNGTQNASKNIRAELYQLGAFTNEQKLIDIGNIKAGENIEDTHFALKEVLQIIYKNNCIAIILGGDATLSLAQFNSFTIFENNINVAHINSKFEWSDEEKINSKSYMYQMLLNPLLNKFSLIAYQTYFLNNENLRFLFRNHHSHLRVGKIRESVIEAEPYLREADMVTFNINAIRYSDAPAQPNPSPNGMFGDEACAVARYAGMADKMQSIGFYDYNPALDVSNITAKQIAQMVWYFIEGISLRKGDYPIVNEADFNIYNVSIADTDQNFVFLKSKKSDRWWMKIIYEKNNKNIHKIIPCTYKDYMTALNNEIPEKWLREYTHLE